MGYTLKDNDVALCKVELERKTHKSKAMFLPTFRKLNRLQSLLVFGAVSALLILAYLSTNTKIIESWYHRSEGGSSSRLSKLATPISGTNWTLNDFINHFQILLGPPTDSHKQSFENPCHGNTACTPNCTRPLSNSSDERLTDVLMSPNLTLSNQQRDNILSMTDSIPENDIIFLSASSSNHYDEMQAMFHNLHTVVFPILPNITVVLFDIGLTEEQRMRTERNCRCHLLRFPVEKFPPHMKENICYSWKPVIIRATMEKARQILVYQDASIRWSPNIIKVLNRTRTFGLQYHRSDFISRISLHTMREMFDYFGESPCAFSPFPEIEANNGMYKNDPFVIHAVLEPWARCALEPSCICPVPPATVVNCNKPVAEPRCHRFDQSAMGILTTKLFNKDIHRILGPGYHYVGIRREHKMKDYFYSLENPQHFANQTNTSISKV
ncbi:unnamed protein product [Lymnaea stagnalis]|uniref:Uncharacterized protein n=1 Tax=Lymnaea stagnalis TaxID=6523 RepID=A0AAV2H0P2_LYMST